MKKIKVNLIDTPTIEAASHTSIMKCDLTDDLKIYYPILRDLVNFLDVDYPDLALWGSRYIPRIDGRMSSAISVTPKDDSNIKHNLLLIGNIKSNPIYLAGVIAHEMRHFWQKKYKYNTYFNSSNNYGSSTNFVEDYAEVDADAFGIVYITQISNLSIEEAAGILCKYEKENDIKAFQKRIDLAYQISSEFHPKMNILQKILQRLGIKR